MRKISLYLIIFMVVTMVLSSCGSNSTAEEEPDNTDNFVYYLNEKIPEEVREIVLNNRQALFVSVNPDFAEHPEKYLALDYDESADLNVLEILKESDSIPSSIPYLPLETIEKELDFLMDYLKYYYGAYAYYGGDDVFLPMKENILNELKGKDPDAITPSQYTDILYTHLSNALTDCHFAVGNRQFIDTQRHRYFLHNTDYLFYQEEHKFFCESEDNTYELISVDGEAPHYALLPYLSDEGFLTWIIGHPSTTLSGETAIVELYNEISGEIIETEVGLIHRNPRLSFDNLMYNEYEKSGIQIIESRRCSPLALEENMDILMAEAGENLRDKELIVIDIRDNGGGNATYPRLWLSALIEQKISPIKGISTERRTRTSHYIQPFEPDISYEDYIQYAQEYPGWLDPYFSNVPPQENKDRIFIVLVNANTSSAGEFFAVHLRQVENTIIIGTNTVGAYATGNVNTIYLPYSKVSLRCGYGLNLEPDLSSIEGIGILPDIWTESDKALERTLQFIENYGLGL